MNRGYLLLGTLALVASGLFFAAGCSRSEQGISGTQQTPATEAPASATGTGSLDDKVGNDTITIASFNLMNFGKSKAADDRAMDIIARTLAGYDITAVQEIENIEGTAILALRDRMNKASGARPARRYEVLVGERVGTNSKEQYAFIYDTDTIAYAGESYTYADAGNKFERPPFVAKFKVIKGAARESASAFDFALADIHTKPDNATTEIMALEDVIADAQTRLNEKDVIALGDYNAGGSYFNTKTMTSGIRDTSRWLWIIPDNTDTTVATGNQNTYDRIVAPARFTQEDYSGNWGVLKFDRENGLSNTEAKTISDHYPVYAVFFITRDSD
jgi:endonuclease/exonuclease/phosphatase family metal-dependent hydrolase